MPRKMSELSDDQLTHCLSRIREIAAMGDEAALIETDKLVWELAKLAEEEEYGGSRERVIRADPFADYAQADAGDNEGVRLELATRPSYHSHEDNSALRMEERITPMEDKIARGVPLRDWEISVLRDSFRGNGYFYGGTTEAGQARFADLKKRAMAVAAEAEKLAVDHLVREALEGPLLNVTSVSILLDKARVAEKQAFGKNLLTEEIADRLRRARERAITFRSKRRMDEAAVATAGGATAKAARLRAEAQVMLAQDWVMAFPAEAAPTLK